MPWLARAGGSWRTITAPAVRVGGTWRTVTAGWVRVGGTWRQFFGGGGGGGPTVSISNATVNDVGVNNPAGAGYSLVNTGAIQTRVNFVASGAGNWITPQTGMSGYDARATVTGGGGGSLSGTVGSWVNLASSQTWELSSAVSGALVSRTLLIEIRDAATLSVLTTATITLNVEAA